MGIGRRLLLWILLGLFSLVLIIAAVSAYLYKSNIAPAPGMPGIASFTVEEGQGFNAVAEDLEQAGLIRSALAARVFYRLSSSALNIKAGSYEITSGMDTRDIIVLLDSGAQKTYSVTIPEGSTINRIASILESEGIVRAAEFLAYAGNSDLLVSYGLSYGSLDGFLFPDTYKFPLNYAPEKVCRLMVRTFFNVLKEVYPDYTRLSEQELRDKIVVASIVEREYRDRAETSLMASVFYNRLDIGMRLESCATVVYVLTEILGRPHPSVLYYSDLEVESPYNTYRIGGLPPGVICNPGRDALWGVFHPEKTDYLFFLLKDPGSGRHQFSKSLAEHDAAYNLYIKDQ